MIGGHKVIALCMAKIHEQESDIFIEMLNKQAVSEGYRLFVYSVCSNLYLNTPYEEGEKTVFELIDYDRIDALLIYEERFFDKNLVAELVRKAKSKKVPVITIGDSVEGSISIQFDYKVGFEKIVRHIVEDHKLTDIHFIAGLRENTFSEDRKRVVEKVLTEKGLPFDEETMVSYGYYWSGQTQEAVEALIQRGKLPQAIICVNDYTAITTCNVLKNHGYSVPRDIVVTGYDGVDEIMFSRPQVTSCQNDYRDLAAKAVELVNRLAKGETLEQTYYVGGKLIVAESCGCPGRNLVSAWEYIEARNNRFFGLQEMNRTFTELSAKIQTYESLDDTDIFYHSEYISDMCCLINKTCVDQTVNPANKPEGQSFDDTMLLLFDTEGEEKTIREISKEEVVPRLEELLCREVPLIFVALNASEIPLGYVCFHYGKWNISRFDKIPQTVNFLNNAIGGYRNMRYQHYLAGQIEEMYKTDALTGLYNRTGFMAAFDELQNNLVTQKSPYTVILIDLDGLKYINDTYGHGEGDNAIYQAARALKSMCPEEALCVRFGGDEMLAVLKGVYDTDALQKQMEEFLNHYNRTEGKPYEVSASLGIYIADGSMKVNFEDLLKRTDEQMYMRKEAKKANGI